MAYQELWKTIKYLLDLLIDLKVLEEMLWELIRDSLNVRDVGFNKMGLQLFLLPSDDYIFQFHQRFQLMELSLQ